MRVLFICRGNLCRSPMAMALFNHLVCQYKLPGVSAGSAGYCDWSLFPREAHPFARRAVEALCGTDLLVKHRAVLWIDDAVSSSDLVVVAEQWMRDDFPAGKTLTMRQLAGRDGDVEDPYGGDYDAFVACAREILQLIESGWPLLVGSKDLSPRIFGNNGPSYSIVPLESMRPSTGRESGEDLVAGP